MGEKCRRPNLAPKIKDFIVEKYAADATFAFLQNNILFSGSNMKFSKSRFVEDTFPVIIEKVLKTLKRQQMFQPT